MEVPAGTVHTGVASTSYSKFHSYHSQP